MKLLEKIKNILKFKEKVKNKQEKIQKRITELNRLKVDIYHILAHGNLDAIKIMLLSSIFRKRLQERAKLKDEKRDLAKLLKVFEEYESFFDDLENVLFSISQSRKGREDRCYTPRSEEGKELINRFCNKEDGFNVLATKEQIKRLQEAM